MVKMLTILSFYKMEKGDVAVAMVTDDRIISGDICHELGG